MRASLSRERFTLSQDQLAAALGLAGVTPQARAGLPAPSPPGRKGGALRETPLVDRKGGLTPEAAAALAVLAAPQWQLVVRENRAGQPDWTTTELRRGRMEGPFVAWSPGPGPADVSLLPTVADARQALSDVLDVTDLPAVDVSPLELSLEALVALLAVADLLQDTALRARLARQRPRPPALTAEALAQQVDQGLRHDHTRWAVTVGRLTGPVDLGPARSRLAAGLTELAQAGLVRDEGGGVALTRSGFELADAWSQLVGSASLALATAAGDEPFAVVQQVSVLRTPSAVWAVQWPAAADGGRVSGRALSQKAAAELVDELFAVAAPDAGEAEPVSAAVARPAADEEWAPQPAPAVAEVATTTAKKVAKATKTAATKTAEAASPKPKTPAKTPAKKAPKAGQAVDAKEAEPKETAKETAAEETKAATPTAEPAAATTAGSEQQAVQAAASPAVASAARAAAADATIAGWEPSHVVPEGGMPAWGVPDPTSQPVATLGARLPVQVHEERGAWAHVLCSNGWRGWVDGRRLLRLD